MFDPFGLKDLRTRSVIIRCNSTGELYLIWLPPPTVAVLTVVTSPTLWHRRLGHLGSEAFAQLISSGIPCNKSTIKTLCHACQLGRHMRLPLSSSTARAIRKFDLIHCDLWTYPIISVLDYKYYLVILDDRSHFTWTFPLRLKSDVFRTIANFFSFLHHQFGTTIKTMQSDNGREFDNSATCSFFLTHGVTLRMSCPYTSQQNGRVEHMFRTINNIVRSLLFLPPEFWVKALNTVTYLLNRHPTKTLNFSTPYFALHGIHPTYTHLRVFGCRCYPNLSATAPHKLSPRSSLCVFGILCWT